jgi:hypothetical protein
MPLETQDPFASIASDVKEYINKTAEGGDVIMFLMKHYDMCYVELIYKLASEIAKKQLPSNSYIEALVKQHTEKAL